MQLAVVYEMNELGHKQILALVYTFSLLERKKLAPDVVFWDAALEKIAHDSVYELL